MAKPSWLRGLATEDATRRVSINIRQKHIDDAVAGHGERCVAGRCTLQSLDAKAVWFYEHVAYVLWDDEGPALRYATSEALRKDVIRILDDPEADKSTIKPGVYDLLPPSPANRLGTDRRPKPGARKRDVKPTGPRHVKFYGRVTAAKSA